MPTPKKPASLHALTGTKSQAAIPEDPSFPASRPQMPHDLPPLAEQEWRRLCPKLHKRKTLTKADASALEVYCRMYSRWRKVADLAEANPLSESSWLDKNGNEHVKVEESPASKIAARLESQLRAYLTQFSATPASRCRTKPPKEEPTETPATGFQFSRATGEPEPLTADDLAALDNIDEGKIQ